MTRRKTIAAIILTLCLFLLVCFDVPQVASAGPAGESTPAPTFDPARLEQPPTVIPPAQPDNGEQIYWSMCMSCHGDQGQGLTDEWRASYPPDYQDCWQSGCHGSDHADNSFEIPQTGAPALGRAGTMASFETAYDLQRYIHASMPLFPTGSLTHEQSLELTAYLLRQNDSLPARLTLTDKNSAAIPVHQPVSLPENPFPGALVLAGVLFLSAFGISKSGAAMRLARANFVHHLHPPRIPAAQSSFWYTLGAGGLSVFLSLIILVTGLLEMYYYIPTPQQAGVSVQTITLLVPFGGLVRGLHYWSAQLLVIVVTVHLLRVVLTGAYAPPRRFNYLLGLALLVLILLLNFTGYVLRWDEGVHWALVVGTNLLKTIPLIGESVYRFVVGGSEPGAATLTRFYAWHIFGLTLGVIILVTWHAFRVRRDGGIAAAPSEQRTREQWISRFDLVRREVLAMLIAGALLILVALALVPPLEAPIADSVNMLASSQAPWFFLWVQQLLKLGDPFWMGIMVPVLVIIALGLLPYVLPHAAPDELGRWFPRGNLAAQVLAVLILFAIFTLTVWASLP